MTLFVVAILGTLLIRALLREFLIPVLLLFVIGYTMMWINGVPHHEVAQMEEVR